MGGQLPIHKEISIPKNSTIGTWIKILEVTKAKEGIVFFECYVAKYVNKQITSYKGSISVYSNETTLVSIVSDMNVPIDDYSGKLKYKKEAGKVSVWCEMSNQVEGKLYIKAGKGYDTPMQIETPPSDAVLVR